MSSGARIPGGAHEEFETALATIPHPNLAVAVPNPGVQMMIGMRAWQKVMKKLERCKIKQRSYSNQAYLCFGVAIPCALTAFGDAHAGTYLTVNGVAAVIAGICGTFFLRLDSLTQEVEAVKIDSVIEDMTDMIAGFQTTQPIAPRNEETT